MQTIGLIFCVYNVQPPGPDGQDLRRAFERAYFPMLDLLQEFPSIKLSMHWSGNLLEWMDRHAPERLNQILQLARSGRIEILSGLYSSAVMPALPERDVVGQLQTMAKWWREHGDPRMRGVWLPWSAWDPQAARTLPRLGYRFSVLEDHQFYPSIVADGYVLTEREGAALALFPNDASIARMIPDSAPRAILGAITRRARKGVRCLTVAVPGECFGAALDTSATRSFSGPAAWVRQFFQLLTENAHWLKLVQFGTALDRMRPTERAYPPASVSVPVALAALPDPLVEPNLSPGLAPWRGIAWEQLLVRHPEINRLHKRMLLTSLEVARLRAASKSRHGAEGALMEEALEDATMALYRGQTGAAYIVGTDVGAQDGAVRHYAWSNLLRAEFSVAAAMGDANRLRCEQIDYDCDGRAEVLVRTPRLCAILAPAAGGALVELDGWSLPGNILNVRGRRPEVEHRGLQRDDKLPVLIDDQELERTDELPDIDIEETTDVGGLVPLRFVEPGLAEKLHYDRYQRATFLDRFLGSEATLQNVRIGRFPEVGDFVGADYQLLNLEESPAGQAAVTLARDGNVTEGAAVRLVRLVKRYLFHRDQPVVDVHYEVANRYHEPVRSRFAIELNFNLDSAHHPDATLEFSGGRTARLRDSGEVSEVSELTWTDNQRGYRVTLTLKPPARIWHFPIETVSRSPRGVCQQFQGICVMAWWPVELWGLERKRFDLSLSVEC